VEIPAVGKIPTKINPRVNLMGLGNRFNFEKRDSSHSPAPNMYTNVELFSI
jgi:hypothetical protein